MSMFIVLFHRIATILSQIQYVLPLFLFILEKVFIEWEFRSVSFWFANYETEKKKTDKWLWKKVNNPNKRDITSNLHPSVIAFGFLNASELHFKKQQNALRSSLQKVLSWLVF